MNILRGNKIKLKKKGRLKMTEIEKLKAGLEYCYYDKEAMALKRNALIQCSRYNAISDIDEYSSAHS